jgi:hypothetical protein
MAITLCALTNIWARDFKPAESRLSGEDVILQWNRVLKETLNTPRQHPATIMPVRSYAMMHAAMFDAVNSINGTYTPYLIEVSGSKNASTNAAALNEVREIGAANSATRTADQTKVAQLWANVNTPTNFLFVWNNGDRAGDVSRGTTTVENARLFALTNIALHDALQTAFARHRLRAGRERGFRSCCSKRFRPMDRAFSAR